MMKKLFFMYWIGTVSLLFAGTVVIASENTYWVWAALVFAVIGVLVWFVSSRRTKKMEEMYRQMLEKQQEIEQSQTLFLVSISENIHDIVAKNYEDTAYVPDVAGEKAKSIQKEKRRKLLDVTNDLIEFLRLKSKKVEIIHEKFNLNNVLNEVSGSVCSQFKGSDVELIFDIDSNIPRYLIGDARNLERTLQNLLEYVLSEVDSGEVTLEIAMFGNYEEQIELQFRLSDKGQGLSEAQMEALFIPTYDEESQTYSGLGLFVAKSLIEMMQGVLVVDSVVGKGTTFTLTLPFEMLDPSNRRNYRLPEKVLTAKKVFIVDRSYNSGLAIKKMFAYFRHDVKVVTKEEFLEKKHDLSPYDIVVLDESLFNPRTVAYLDQLKKQKAFRVIALNTLLQKDEEEKYSELVDKVLSKPANQERVFELIINLFTPQRVQKSKEEEKGHNAYGLTHRGEIQEAPHISQQSFRDFSGKRLLIVEDDRINQKVLTNILKVSGMEIAIANNGREAVDMVKESLKPFDLVLMDINMPVMDGYVATQMIRLESEYDTLPIVAFTALALESEREKIFNSGMNAYLTKPINIGKLYTVFKMYMPGSGAQKQRVQDHQVIASDVLDIHKGIRYANDNEGFYMEILQEFLDAYGNSGDLFAKLVREHRYEQVKMLCLDMKGLTGSIGATQMYQLIAKIHQKVIYHQEEMLTEYIDAYEKELGRLKSEIERYLSR